MSAIYIDHAGYAKFYEDEAVPPLPADLAAGLTRVELPAHVTRVQPSDIVAAERAHRDAS